ncbi:hypothetical protein SAMN05421846_101366 [Chryseobacterium taeanense]|uniref:Uncharacterized protein n=1 Tax=Chryseobacterium taeanense TaxID=311334 RepID=A0A1G8DYV3_9FLAO|nr:hypothetical protein [Chryseobacterium taeanense]SDH62936.1 hypothetical protein SAMN05421846_101366 [Chryseobacterium taeanense]
MKNLKKLSRKEQTKIQGGFTQVQIEACGGEAYICFRGGGSWGCWRNSGGICYAPMV